MKAKFLFFVLAIPSSFILLTSYFSPFTSCHVSSFTWSPKADFPASSRFYGVGFSIGKKGYYGLGQKQTGLFTYKVYNDLWEYSPETNTWTQRADFPGGGRLGAKGFVVNGKACAGFGYFIMPNGPNAGSNAYQSDVYEFLPDSNKWYKKNDNFMGGSDICFTINDTVWCVNPEYRIIKKYDPVTDTWTEKEWKKKDPAPDQTHITGTDVDFALGGKEYIITSLRKKKEYINQLWEFNPGSAVWIKKKDLPLGGTKDLNAFSLNEKGYVMRSGSDLLEYDPATDTWTPIKETSLPDKEFSSAFALEGKCYGFSKYKFWEFAP